ncbi:hypothetical protein AVEN_39185-1 [Araneus ventricosus]|uniref:Uncharacterized protein n=1 Tax=Araneus ventricosus TaxID=182803 RepID=A0A4Y2MNV9_ARAVE|nr:hypothetical protein AVEN_39185-1 [Araneus ventricosus]
MKISDKAGLLLRLLRAHEALEFAFVCLGFPIKAVALALLGITGCTRDNERRHDKCHQACSNREDWYDFLSIRGKQRKLSCLQINVIRKPSRGTGMISLCSRAKQGCVLPSDNHQAATEQSGLSQ